MLVNQHLTSKQIASRRGTSIRAVNKIRSQLRERGLIDQHDNAVPQNRPPSGTSASPRDDEKYRVHAQEFSVGIVHKSDTYTRAYKMANVVPYEGQTLHLFPGRIVVHFNEHFWGATPEIALSRSFEYLNAFLRRLESEYRVTLLKSRKHNVRMVRLHCAETENELARDVNLTAEKIRVYGTDDGKAWFEIDNSWNLNEAETIHHTKAVQDMAETIGPFFNDLRDNPHLLPSILSAHQVATEDVLRELGEHIRETRKEVEDLRAYVSQRQPAPSATDGGRPWYVG